MIGWGGVGAAGREKESQGPTGQGANTDRGGGENLWWIAVETEQV
jgi:hypothetical protein